MENAFPYAADRKEMGKRDSGSDAPDKYLLLFVLVPEKLSYRKNNKFIDKNEIRQQGRDEIGK